MSKNFLGEQWGIVSLQKDYCLLCSFQESMEQNFQSRFLYQLVNLFFPLEWTCTKRGIWTKTRGVWNRKWSHMGGKSGKLFWGKLLDQSGVWSKLQAWLGLRIVRREGGSQLREQASQGPSAECGHSWGSGGHSSMLGNGGRRACMEYAGVMGWIVSSKDMRS